jgi:hypothetical protein
MMRGWLIEDEGRTPEAFRRELLDPAATRRAERERHDARLVGEWVIDPSTCRPVLRFDRRQVDSAGNTPGSRVA